MFSAAREQLHKVKEKKDRSGPRKMWTCDEAQPLETPTTTLLWRQDGFQNEILPLQLFNQDCLILTNYTLGRMPPTQISNQNWSFVKKLNFRAGWFLERERRCTFWESWWWSWWWFRTRRRRRRRSWRSRTSGSERQTCSGRCPIGKPTCKSNHR